MNVAELNSIYDSSMEQLKKPEADRETIIISGYAFRVRSVKRPNACKIGEMVEIPILVPFE
jgi:hypothetical protein